MDVKLEPLTRYDRTFRYSLHEAYFQQRGIGAWNDNEIPHEITTNFGTARQHVRVLLAHFLSHEAALGDSPYVVLEIGGGLGRFGNNFFRALDTLDEPGTDRLRSKLRYLFSDVSPLSVEQAAAAPDLAPWAASGRLVPALFDVRSPTSLTTLDGAPLEDQVHAVIVNYVVCTTPVRIVQKRHDDWLDLYSDVVAPVSDEEETPPNADTVRQRYLDEATRPGAMAELTANVMLMPIDLDAAFDAPHPAILRALFQSFDIATAAYPESFVECFLALSKRMPTWGLFAIGDLGRAHASEMEGEKVPMPLHYGNTLNHSINFGLFDAMARALGLSVVRTHSYLPSIVQAVLSVGAPLAPAVEAAFQAHVVDRHEGHELLDCCEAAVDAVKSDTFYRAARFFAKALAIDRHSPRLLYLYGETCVYAGYNELARDLLLEWWNLDGNVHYDFDFLLGRVFAALGQPDQAKVWLESSLRKDEHPITLTNLAEVHLQLGNEGDAYVCYRKALERDPNHEQAKTRLNDLKESMWRRYTEPFEERLKTE